MTICRRWLLSCALSTLLASAGADAFARPHAHLAAFRDDAELQRVLDRWQAGAAALRADRQRSALGSLATPTAPPAAGDAATAKSSLAAESITNVQTAGVDEGGIVKHAGDHLVVLRRGRLFTVRVGGDALRPVATVDAYAPGSDPRGAWYDELLVSGSTVIVIGYSYARGGTEIGLFELGADGGLAYRATWHLRSFDYWSSRNYASRLVGGKLVLYTPTLLSPGSPRPWEQMPGLRRWQGEATPPDFQRLLPATRVYRSDDDFDPRQPLALHTVTSCEVARTNLACESTAVLGPAGRVFYVSADAVFVWTSAWRRHDAGETAPGSAVFRLPLDGGAPSGLKTAGVPIDQLSFLEQAGHLNVLLRRAGRGEGMWGGEQTAGGMALLRVPLSAFGDGRASAQREHYRALPGPAGHAVQNRFVGDWLVWGGGGARTSWPDDAGAWALRYADNDAASPLATGHAVERIEAMGRHAVLVGSAGADLQFTALRLSGGGPRLAGTHVQAGARQGETRSHGFYFRPTGGDDGVLGLPVLDAAQRGRHGVYSGGHGAASVLFLRQRDLDFTALGRLESAPAGRGDDGCKASCVDWYGNARPIFLGDRVFALLGYELVEGRLDERMVERRRISFAPARAAGGRYSPFE